MMESYSYTKWVDTEVLREAINLRTTLRKIVTSIRVDGSPDNYPEDNIIIETSRALLSAEQDEITNIVNAINESYDLVIRKNLEKNTMSWAIKTGQEILAQFGANNLYSGKTAEQVHQLATAYPELIHSLITGSLQTTYGIFLSMQPDENFTQDEISEFTLRLAIILGL